MTDLHLVTDDAPERVRTLLFATPPLEYVADTARQWADKGFGGFLRPDIVRGWQIDIWETPDGERIEGDDNPKLRTCARMNAELASVGVTENFIVIPFSKQLPAWSDDDAWHGVVENFRQAARFARMAGFRGLALDDEYIEDSLGFSFDGNGALNHDMLRRDARRRGRQIQEAVLDEYPDMVTLHLPESYSIMGELAQELFLGYMDVLAERNAPGGMHVLPEWTYFQTNPFWVALYGYGLDRIFIDDFSNTNDTLGDYWKRRCSIALGQAPLGYLRFIRDESGKRLGYGGRKEVFGDRILQAGEDKSGNYSADAFRVTNAAARMVSSRYTWIFAGGPVWWQMSEEEHEKYGGTEIATLPLTDNFDEYTGVLTAPSRINDTIYAAMQDAVENRTETNVLAGLGMPPCWWAVGPFPNPNGRGWNAIHVSETWKNLKMEVNGVAYHGINGPAQWDRYTTPSTGYVDLSRMISGGTEVLAYAVTWIESDAERDVVVRFGSDDTGKVWFNGKLVHESNTERIAVPDEDTIYLTLPEGKSQFLLKIGNYRGGYGFYFRITDEAGAEIPGLKWVTEL